MDKILNAANDIMAATNVELSLKCKAKEQVIKILQELVEEKFTSTNTPSMPCQAMNVHRVLLLAGVEKCPVCHKLLG